MGINSVKVGDVFEGRSGAKRWKVLSIEARCNPILGTWETVLLVEHREMQVRIELGVFLNSVTHQVH